MFKWLRYSSLLVVLWIGATAQAQVDTVSLDDNTSLQTPFAAPQMSNDSIAHNQGILSTYTAVQPRWEDSVMLLKRAMLDMQHFQVQLENEKQALQKRNEQLISLNDSLVASNDHYQQSLQEKNQMLENKIQILQEKEQLVAEKDALYRKALVSSSLDSAKYSYEMLAKEASIEAKVREIELLQRNIDDRDASLKDEKASYERLVAERQQCMHMVDSLREIVVAVEKENVRKQEENKYLAQKAKDAQDQVNAATNRKKKVRPVQGIAMRFFRTPDWNIRLTAVEDAQGNASYARQIWNRNSGSIEFDYITGASVMLWDLSKYFNQKPDSAQMATTLDFRKFDQQFAYDLGVYVGFGGTNLFKNFYIGPSFRFMDFFYLVAGVNICEYEMLSQGFKDGQNLLAGETLDNIVTKAWLVKPFVGLSIDLDFLSYIKK